MTTLRSLVEELKKEVNVGEVPSDVSISRWVCNLIDQFHTELIRWVKENAVEVATAKSLAEWRVDKRKSLKAIKAIPLQHFTKTDGEGT